MKSILSVLFLFPFFVKSQTGTFTFTLPAAARTSAGVYKTDSTLVRTLWADRNYSAGTYTEYWDGKDDYGVKLTSPDANYNIKVLSNNVTYKWEGIVGNTSSLQTTGAVQRNVYTSMTGIAITGTTAYFCQGYSEGLPSIAKFNTASPQARILVVAGPNSTGTVDFICTDGTYVYNTGYDAYAVNNTFAAAIRVSNDTYVVFPNGTPGYSATHVRYYAAGTLDFMNTPRSKPTGIAVQQTGSYLFLARGGINRLSVMNKTTGAIVQILTYSNPRYISTDGNSLWMCTGTTATGNTIAKYTVNANGTLSAPTLTLSGITIPGATQSNGSGTIAIIDSTNQVVRFFNTSTGVEGTQLGTNGGYSANPTVTNTRFMFNDYRGNTFSFLAFAPDGSFWVGDPGNYRELHYNSSKAWIETIMSMGASYSTCVDPNNINRLFANYLEFAIDYSQPLSATTGWTLVKNWGYSSLANTTTTITLSKLLNVVTLSNGRTYGYNYMQPIGLVELTSTGLRLTGVDITNRTGSYSISSINADGSLTKFSGWYDTGSTVTYSKSSLSGFDASGNPIWSKTGTLLATTPTNTLKHPNNFPGNVTPVSYNFVTTSGKVIFYNPSKYYTGTTLWNGYHLGAIKKGQNTWLWETQKVDNMSYTGTFPEADYFEIGNGVNQYAGSNVNVIDNNIFTGYHGEFWKNSQTNYFNHYYEDGLAIGQFGTDGSISLPTDIGAAGNALSPVVVKDASGDLYVYHGDESAHAGIHRWKISNLSSIQEQYISIAYPSNYYRIAYGYLDLHSGLPFISSLPNSAGWSESGGIVTSNTGLKKYIDDGSPDVYTYSNISSGTAAVNRDLGVNNVTNNWKISGQITFEESDFIVGSFTQQYVDVLDAAGKIITRFNYIGNPTTKVLTIYANASIIDSRTGLSPTLNQFQPFEVNVVNGVITFTYADYPPVTAPIFDATANWKQPKILRQYWTGKGTPARVMYIGFMDMRFYKDYYQTNIPPIANAGSDQTITLPVNNVTLTGSGTDADGTIANYSWTKISGPSSVITNSNNSTTTVTGLLQGTYKFELKVTDDVGATNVDTVQVIVNPPANIPPVANAGTDQTITLPLNNVTLTGSGTDANGTVTNYLWTKISGPASGTITNPNNFKTTVTGFTQSITYMFELKVTDNAGATNVDTVQITVNPPANIPPVANAGPDQSITLPVNLVSLAGSGGDADGNITGYLWTKISGPLTYNIVNPTSPVTDISGLVNGVYKFELKVTDNNAAIARDTIQITVNVAANIPPDADAGTDQMLLLPRNKIALNGVGTDVDGSVISYLWTKIAGPTALIALPNSASTSVSQLIQGDYLFELKVTDNNGTVGKDTVQITVVASSLPLKLLSFTGKINNEKINLQWETTNEKNILEFEIERMNTNTWNKIGFVPPATGGLISNQYTYMDSLPLFGINYYRLKIIDIDGKFVYSDIISFEINPTNNLIHQNFPNPFSNYTNIKFEIAQKSAVKIIVYNAVGIQMAVLVDEMKLPGVYQAQWNIANAAQGNYFYKLIVDDNVVVKKMLKLY